MKNALIFISGMALGAYMMYNHVVNTLSKAIINRYEEKNEVVEDVKEIEE